MPLNRTSRACLGVSQVPELSDTAYTRNDFLKLCKGQEDLAKECFYSVDWQHPESWIEEQFADGEWKYCEQSGKIVEVTGEEDEEPCPTDCVPAGQTLADPHNGAQQEAEKDAAPKTIFSVEANPRCDSAGNGFFIQAYLSLGNGTAEIGEVLFIGTAEKCCELLAQLNAGTLTQEQVKELYLQMQGSPCSVCES